MSSEIELISETTSHRYKSREENEVTVIKIQNSLMMTVKEIASLYGVQRPAIYKQLKDIFQRRELNKKEVSNILTQRADDGKLYRTTFYNQDVIYAVGERINPQEAEKMRLWFDKNTK